MIIGELDLDRAERDPAYLARVKAFLAPRDQAEPVGAPAAAKSADGVHVALALS